jgi:DNA-binding CsgD family transcriptional regulator
MDKYSFKAYEDMTLAKIKQIAANLNIISIECYAVDETAKIINIFNSDTYLLKDRLIKFVPNQDLRLNNLLPSVSLYSDFIKISPDPLRSRKALDFLEAHDIKDILTFYQNTDINKRVYISFAMNHSITNIAQCYEQYQKIAHYLFDQKHLDYKNTTLLKAEYITKECPKSLTNKELQVLSFLTKGMNALEISQEKFISKRTVDKHIENIRKKLNVPSTSSLIAKYAFWQNNMSNLITC